MLRKIVSRAGKLSGKNKNCFKVQDDYDETVGCINLDELDDWSAIPTHEEKAVMFISEDITAASE